MHHFMEWSVARAPQQLPLPNPSNQYGTLNPPFLKLKIDGSYLYTDGMGGIGGVRWYHKGNFLLVAEQFKSTTHT